MMDDFLCSLNNAITSDDDETTSSVDAKNDNGQLPANRRSRSRHFQKPKSSDNFGPRFRSKDSEHNYFIGS